MVCGSVETCQNHAQVTTLSNLKLTQKKLQRAYGYVLKITEFYWTQSIYYLHETLIKHWDPFKFLKMATKLLMTYGGIILIIHVFQINRLSTTPHSSFHHLHTHTHKLYISLHITMHVSTRTCYIHHKTGVTGLAYGTLLGVLW